MCQFTAIGQSSDITLVFFKMRNYTTFISGFFYYKIIPGITPGIIYSTNPKVFTVSFLIRSRKSILA